MVYFLENMQLNKNGVSRAIGGRMTFVWGLKHFPCCCFSQEAYIIDIAGLVTNKHSSVQIVNQTEFVAAQLEAATQQIHLNLWNDRI